MISRSRSKLQSSDVERINLVDGTVELSESSRSGKAEL